MHLISTSFSCLAFLSPKFNQILKYFAQSCDCMIAAFRNSGCTVLNFSDIYFTEGQGTIQYYIELYCTSVHFTERYWSSKLNCVTGLINCGTFLHYYTLLTTFYLLNLTKYCRELMY